MSTKRGIKPRKHKHKDDNMKQEIVVQVHKTVASDEQKRHEEEEEEKSASNNNEEVRTMHMTSRDASVDEESQINSKILSLIETEMKRDAKHAHFTESRPQSLSFYEDEKAPEELSGNLELLSPEERKHYKKRSKELDEERNTYNAANEALYNNVRDDEIVAKKSKSRKKRHDGDHQGLGDSREMMIPKEKRKSKKKKHDVSPMVAKKNKHKKGGDDQIKSEIILALEELQDDVFDTSYHEEYSNANKTDRVKRSPRKADKLYIQRKSKFEPTSRTNLNRQSAYDFEEEFGDKKSRVHPLEIAIPVQEYWIRFSTLCHGLLGGLAFGHWLYLVSNCYTQDEEFILHYSHFSDAYVTVFYVLCTICLISVFERLDIARLDCLKLRNLSPYKSTSAVILVYLICLIVHLAATEIDYKLALVSYNNETISNITSRELTQWNHLSSWRSLLAFLAWIILGLSPQDNMFYVHLRSMERYIPGK